MTSEEMKPLINRLKNNQRLTIMEMNKISAYIKFLEDTLVNFNKIIDACYEVMSDAQIEEVENNVK